MSRTDIPDYSSYDIKTPRFIPIFTWAKVVKVYDGDTITVVGGDKKMMEIGIPPYKYSCRLYGIDTPEITKACDEEKEYGKIITLFLRKLIINKIIRVEIVPDDDKYGRLLTKIYLDKIDISKLLLDKKFAVPYYGGKKDPWEIRKKCLDISIIHKIKFANISDNKITENSEK